MNDEDQIQRMLQAQERRIRRILELAIREYKGSINLAQLERAIIAGDTLSALREVEDIARAVTTASQQAFITAAQASTAYIEAKRTITIGFDQVNQRAVTLLDQNSYRFIKEFTDKQIAATRVALRDGVERGLNPRQLAVAFRDSIGLTETQEDAVRNYRRLLQRIGSDDVPNFIQREALDRNLRDARHDDRLKRLIRDKKNLTSTEIDNMVEKYRGRYIKYRSEVIARSEALSSVHEGQDNAFDEAFRRGTLEKDRVIGQWLTRVDGRERDWHKALNRKKSPIGVPFVNEKGAIMYPGDRDASAENVIQCRCARVLRILAISGG